MIWDIEYSKKSQKDIENIRNYISNELKEVEISEKLLIRILDKE